MATGNYTVLDGNGSAIFFQTESGDGSQATPFVPAVLARGGLTAAGTVTAEVKGTLTAEAKGTITAEVKGTLTAQTKGILTAMVSGGDFYLGTLTAGGQITAHGTITALAKGVVTSMISGGDFYLGTITAGGQVTAHGTVTAETKGTLTAQVKGGTATVYHAPTMAWLLSANNAVGTGSALGALGTNYNFIMLWASGNSASADLMAGADSARWSKVTSWSLGPDQTATAQFTGYFPYLAGQVSWVSAEGAASGTVWMQGAGVK